MSLGHLKVAPTNDQACEAARDSPFYPSTHRPIDPATSSAPRNAARSAFSRAVSRRAKRRIVERHHFVERGRRSVVKVRRRPKAGMPQRVVNSGKTDRRAILARWSLAGVRIERERNGGGLSHEGARRWTVVAGVGRRRRGSRVAARRQRVVLPHPRRPRLGCQRCAEKGRRGDRHTLGPLPDVSPRRARRRLTREHPHVERRTRTRTRNRNYRNLEPGTRNRELVLTSSYRSLYGAAIPASARRARCDPCRDR